MLAQRAAILIEIFNRPTRDACFHGSFDNGYWYSLKKTRIKWLRNDVLRTKLQRLTIVGQGHFFRCLLLCKVNKPIGTGDLHFVVDRGGATVQCASEQEGEAENVIYLVGEVRTTGANNRIGARLSREIRMNLWIRVCHGQNKWVWRHLLNHVLGHTVAC